MSYKRSTSKVNNEENAEALNDLAIELDKKRQVTVRKFNNVNLVDIREFYIDKDTKEKKPGKKGISLTEDSWKKLVGVVDQVQEALDGLNGLSTSKKFKQSSEDKAYSEEQAPLEKKTPSEEQTPQKEKPQPSEH